MKIAIISLINIGNTGTRARNAHKARIRIFAQAISTFILLFLIILIYSIVGCWGKLVTI